MYMCIHVREYMKTHHTCACWAVRGSPKKSIYFFWWVTCVIQQTCLTCLVCDTADMSAVSDNRHVCGVTQQTCLLCDTADMSPVSDNRRVCGVAQQTCL